jgi:(2Fe-2S) ferredoxin
VVADTPDKIFYGRVRQEDVGEIVDALAKDEVVERLRLPVADFDQATAAPGLPEDPPASS